MQFLRSMQCLPQGTRLSDHLQTVVYTVYLNDIPLCHRNPARVARPSLSRASDAIHPVLGKGVVWFTRLDLSMIVYIYIASYLDQVKTHKVTLHICIKIGYTNKCNTYIISAVYADVRSTRLRAINLANICWACIQAKKNFEQVWHI